MITKIHLQGFKCFKESIDFPLTKINLLTGINGKGKSTLLQSLLLFKQSLEKNRNTDRIYLRGNSIDLGYFKDIKNSDTPADTNIIIGFQCDENSETFFELCENIATNQNYADESIANIASIKHKKYPDDWKIYNVGKIKRSDKITIESYIYHFCESLEKIHYVSADRIGPLKYHDNESLNENFITVGARGEFCINVLAKLQKKEVNEVLYLGNDAQTLIQQTEEWLNYILSGAKITIKGAEKDSDSSVLTILFNTKKTEERYKPINVGFGYSYILPIIVSGLIAEKGEILIIENPEAHLHPGAQSRITEFLSRVASTGIQVFIESHSEHVLNGVRISTLNKSIGLKKEDISILYFKDDSFEHIPVLEKGAIETWPEGFFDQQEKDFHTLLGF